MTRDVKVKPETFAALKRHFDDRRILELTATIAAYNMVSWVLVALEIEAEPN
jgi:alkylhydroperoxidase family enzyme